MEISAGNNRESLGISFIGYFQDVPPKNITIEAALKFFDDAMALGKISEDYKINAMMDFRDNLEPGEAFMKIIRLWPRYSRTK